MNARASGSIVLMHAVGLHARPSVKLTKLAKTFASAIRLGTRGVFTFLSWEAPTA